MTADNIADPDIDIDGEEARDGPALTLREAAARHGVTPADLSKFPGKAKRRGRWVIPRSQMLNLLDFLTDWSGIRRPALSLGDAENCSEQSDQQVHQDGKRD
ncbi:MAG TPA: hypothetical protein VK920_06485 [Solirubrobacterales bacterium]|nr:hypothetical protein [Solirubrobacterales bacterium]